MNEHKTIVFFDLKTTDGNSKYCHIIQLSAVRGANIFDEYVFPLRPISPMTQRLNGFTISDGCLVHHGEFVQTVSPSKALSSFIDFLSDFRRPVLLAAHSAKRFDVPILKRLLRWFNLEWRFWRVVSGFLDTLELSRSLYPNLNGYSQPELAKLFLGYDYDDYGPHGAVEDATVLQDLFYWWTSNRWNFVTFQ
ncbi:DNA polymerase III PolC-type-like [Centropristis striata]|uniref:DNA polymerase III PolC-type-like n=1 Tax=Centropristis striata TaxID=184440 RepID=UPI0027E00E65|nr:DNA polymerase III PolC-type-like [Centropristis striata]